jgi:hypothetical protein
MLKMVLQMVTVTICTKGAGMRIGKCGFAVAVGALCLLHPLTGADQKWTGSVPVVEREPRAQELASYPVDKTNAGVNPPGFCWTPHDQAIAYRLEVAAASAPDSPTLAADRLTSTVYAHTAAMAPGDYLWHVVYYNSHAKAYGVSRTRSFTISAGTPELPMPDVGRMRDRLKGVRPRMFLHGDRLATIRKAVQDGQVPQWQFLVDAAESALREPPYREPAGYKNAEFNVEDWRRIYGPGKVGSAHLARLAFAYRVTGDKRYLDGARRWMMNLASWDPTGIMSHDVPQVDGSEGNDEASMPILDRMALAWDWIGGELSPAERARVLAVMPERGNQVLRKLKQQDFLSHPFENHEGRVLAFLGNAGLAFLGDLPEAEVWLDYVLRCYLTSFPGWGGDEGGWAQGIGYWSAYVYWLSTFAESLRSATGIDVLKRPFYRHNGRFPVYFHPPYAPMGAFGDGGDGKPTLHEKLLIEYFAGVYRDPLIQWHGDSIRPEVPKVTYAGEARQWNEWFLEDVVSAWRAGTERPAAPAPKGDRVARHLADIGWAAMHSALGDATNDVWVLFKSSRFGSFSHSHADQNTFQLNAWGEALAIDSGYYPYYGSPHHVLWTRQTRAHNGILVNGRGQPPYNWEASGRIEKFVDQGLVTLVRGQAGSAYNVPPTSEVVEMWRKHVKEPLPPMEPKVDSFERTLAFVSSREHPVLFVLDDIRTGGPATFAWLLHALQQMQIGTDDAVTVTSGKVRLAVKVISTSPLELSQTSEFTVKPEERAAGSPDQWHLAARTTSSAASVKYLAVLVPYREGTPEPLIEVLKGPDTAGFRVGGAEAAAWWGTGSGGGIRAGEIAGQGRLVVRAKDGVESKTVVDR